MRFALFAVAALLLGFPLETEIGSARGAVSGAEGQREAPAVSHQVHFGPEAARG